VSGTVEKRPSAAFPSPFVVAAYKKIRLTSQDSGALHLDIFEQPLKVKKIIGNPHFSKYKFYARLQLIIVKQFEKVYSTLSEAHIRRG
jgi:hypothetical protein